MDETEEIVIEEIEEIEEVTEEMEAIQESDAVIIYEYLEPVEPVMTDEDLQTILEYMLLMSENLEIINKKLEGEFDAEGNLLETPEEQTELFALQEIHTETVAQSSILTELYQSEIDQEPYRYDLIESTNGHLLNISDNLETVQTTIGETADINYLAQSSVLTYSTVYLPLVAIILSLWWFFKNFLNRIR